jgi:hypothetical protein
MGTETFSAFSRAWPLLLAACAASACTPLKPSWTEGGTVEEGGIVGTDGEPT